MPSPCLHFLLPLHEQTMLSRPHAQPALDLQKALQKHLMTANSWNNYQKKEKEKPLPNINSLKQNYKACRKRGTPCRTIYNFKYFCGFCFCPWETKDKVSPLLQLSLSWPWYSFHILNISTGIRKDVTNSFKTSALSDTKGSWAQTQCLKH